MSKPSIPKGTRDFLPHQMRRRNYIFDTVKSVFQKYGYLPIETPTMEKTQTLMGKYGEEGDRLIFRVLNSGDFIKKSDDSAFTEGNNVRFANSVSEKALRYDLTVPFARFVVQNQNELSFPFKRYQIQPVWRADRPQRGRYREFYQCDVDVVGSDSLLYEVELIQIFDEVLTGLKLDDFTIKINNRKILSGLAEVVGEADKLIPITVAIDKLDKIGEEGVVKELREREVSESAIVKLKPLLTIKGSNKDVLEAVTKIVSSSEIGAKGIEELTSVLGMIEKLGLSNAKLEFDPSLARGLNYYTGAIFEVKANNVNIGSICGGGRYDDLTGIFGMKDLSGVGVSFGADRIYDVLEELNLFPTELEASTQLMFANFGDEEAFQSAIWLKMLRDNGIASELYPDGHKLKKQMNYANNKNIPFVALVGEDEMKNQEILVKNMETGEQNTYSIVELVKFFNQSDF
ncbi:histidine--tRNA ligase [Flavobacteriales bacterium]|nr:histidine--tRNA ligase [Flavobacteriales bacterium]MDB4051852.1 histidine--tRNA ligase [Flavobacteriales bacterium]